jgi:hypothetical protein
MPDLIHITAYADWTEILITDAVSSWLLPSNDAIQFQSVDSSASVQISSKRIFMGKRRGSAAISTLTLGVNAPPGAFGFRICKGASGKVTIRSSVDERVNDISGGGSNCAAYRMFVTNRAKREAEEKHPGILDSRDFQYSGVPLDEQTIPPL